MKLLIIAPAFPPVNTPDMHRVRLSIPLFEKEGIDCTVVAVQPGFVEASTDPVLEKHVHFKNVIRIKAFRPEKTRRFGLGNLGYRSMLFYNRTVKALVKDQKFDLIYFSTTAFPVMALGPIWKKRYGIPFVIDMQDPWRNDFYLTKPKNERPPKYFIAHRMNSVLERFTMKVVDGLISVSEAYPKALKERYSLDFPSEVIPFSASESDFKLIKEIALPNQVFKKEEGYRYILYTGAITPGMPIPLKILLQAFKDYINETGDHRIRLIFVGTMYGKSVEDKYRVKPISDELGMSEFIVEKPERVGYFDAIKVLVDADMIIFPGSLDEGYTASKIFPYILSRRPIFALSHEKSSVAPIIEGSKAGSVIRFTDQKDLESQQESINNKLRIFLEDLPTETDLDMSFFSQYSETTMVKRQINFFNKVIGKKNIK